MNYKKIITAVLGLFVLVSIGAMVFKGINTSSEITASVSSEKVSQGKRIEATYFHGTQRCYTCNLMEKYIREVMNSDFNDSLKSGKIVFQSIDVQEPVNNHFISDYKLYTKSFILSLKDDANSEVKWVNCEQIWNLANNEDMFKKYIKLEVEKFLGML